MFKDETQVDNLENMSEEVDVEVDNAEDTTEVTDWEAEAKKWKAIAGRKAKKVEQTQTQTTVETGLSSKEVERLTLKIDGYNDAEISEIMKLGGLKALSNPLVKKAVDVMRQERQVESAQVDTEGSTSTISRKYSEADLRKMSSAELEKVLSQG